PSSYPTTSPETPAPRITTLACAGRPVSTGLCPACPAMRSSDCIADITSDEPPTTPSCARKRRRVRLGSGDVALFFGISLLLRRLLDVAGPETVERDYIMRSGGISGSPQNAARKCPTTNSLISSSHSFVIDPWRSRHEMDCRPRTRRRIGVFVRCAQAATGADHAGPRHRVARCGVGSDWAIAGDRV